MRRPRAARTRAYAAVPLLLASVLTAACNDIIGNSDKTLLVLNNRVDLVIAVDSEPGMGPKQAVFANAVAALLGRLASPNCVGAGAPFASDSGKCATGTREFAPVDLHLAVVSSSLGPRGSPSCIGGHGNDRGLPLSRGVSADPAGFLTYAPGDDPATVLDGAKALLANVGQDGCLYPAQHESWYRFLVQPDPYDQVSITSDLLSFTTGTDALVLDMRKAFLRPDSIVAVVVLSDHDDQSLDPRSDGGLGWTSLDTTTRAFRPTGTCSVAPTSGGCQSCPGNESDPGCLAGDFLTFAEDPPALRLVTMKQRFGDDRLFPVDRYVRGLTGPLVPDSGGEHVKLSGSKFWSTYGVGAAPKCTNPLYAATLPNGDAADLCNLPPGPRRPDQVFFAAVGGIPSDLVGDGHMTAARYASALGGALSYDPTGVDPRMIEASSPRAGAPSDVDTGGKQLEVACTFDLPSKPASPAAYPMLRQLAVAKGVGDPNAAVGSVCAASDDDPATVFASPLMQLVDRMVPTLAK
jgi:hypothetical protein